MYPFYLELELFKPVSDYFKNKGFIVKREINIGYYRADVVAFKENTVTAVELKLKNWKQAIVQAKNYQLGADYVYIAFPLMKSYNVLRKAEHILKKEHIGFLIVNEETTKVNKIIEAKMSKRKFGTININNLNKIRKRVKRPFY